ncbi:MAG: SAM-dependent methyltransferase [Thermoanaerobaculia bacterium]
MSRGRGSLTVVGLGYGGPARFTEEVRSALQASEKLFYLVTDPVAAAYLRRLQPAAESLHDSYRVGEDGASAGLEMAERILAAVRSGWRTCAAFSGHAAVYCGPAFPALTAAQGEGFPARMLPAVSCLDLLFAELAEDLAGPAGWSIFEATDFLLRPRAFEPRVPLLLLQVGVIGLCAYRDGLEPERQGLELLREVLLRTYPAHQPAILFEAATLPLWPSKRHRLALSELLEAPVTVASTLCVLPRVGGST